MNVYSDIMSRVLVTTKTEYLSCLLRYHKVGSKSVRYEPVLYFGRDIPDSGGHIFGGAVKLQRLYEHFPVSQEKCNILYLVSSSQPPYTDILIQKAKKRGVKIVWNQNGVSYPASEPQKWNKINKDYKKRIHKADYVIYQSLFCKSSADEFLGVFEGPQSIIYNCVDTGFFTPSKNPDISRPLTLLLGGNQYRKYRLETALYTIAKIKQEIPDVRLIVTGTVAWDGKRKDSCMKEVQQVIQHLGITKNVEFTGKYSQKDAPDLYSRADILLHTKWRDPCPGLVIEAMSCGLPIIYSKSGGLPELVADDAGIGIPAKGDWDSIDPPDPELLCNAVLQVAQKLDWYSQNARRLAVTKFDLKDFISSHEKIFKEILEL